MSVIAPASGTDLDTFYLSTGARREAKLLFIESDSVHILLRGRKPGSFTRRCFPKNHFTRIVLCNGKAVELLRSEYTAQASVPYAFSQAADATARRRRHKETVLEVVTTPSSARVYLRNPCESKKHFAGRTPLSHRNIDHDTMFVRVSKVGYRDTTLMLPVNPLAVNVCPVKLQEVEGSFLATQKRDVARRVTRKMGVLVGTASLASMAAGGLVYLSGEKERHIGPDTAADNPSTHDGSMRKKRKLATSLSVTGLAGMAIGLVLYF
jgi:hypothetical protein